MVKQLLSGTFAEIPNSFDGDSAASDLLNVVIEENEEPESEGKDNLF